MRRQSTVVDALSTVVDALCIDLCQNGYGTETHSQTDSARNTARGPPTNALSLEPGVVHAFLDSQEFPRAPVDPPVYGLGAATVRIARFSKSSGGPPCVRTWCNCSPSVWIFLDTLHWIGHLAIRLPTCTSLVTSIRLPTCTSLVTSLDPMQWHSQEAGSLSTCPRIPALHS